MTRKQPGTLKKILIFSQVDKLITNLRQSLWLGRLLAFSTRQSLTSPSCKLIAEATAAMWGLLGNNPQLSPYIRGSFSEYLSQTRLLKQGLHLLSQKLHQGTDTIFTTPMNKSSFDDLPKLLWLLGSVVV